VILRNLEIRMLKETSFFLGRIFCVFSAYSCPDLPLSSSSCSKVFPKITVLLVWWSVLRRMDVNMFGAQNLT